MKSVNPDFAPYWLYAPVQITPPPKAPEFPHLQKEKMPLRWTGDSILQWLAPSLATAAIEGKSLLSTTTCSQNMASNEK